MDVVERSDLTVFPAAAVSVPDVWFEILPFVRSIVNSMDMETDEIGVYEALALGYMTAWLVRDGMEIKAVFLTEHLKTRVSSYIFIYGLAGESIKEWLGLADKALTAYARENGVHKLKTFGRVGWKPFAARQGWKLTRFVFEKDLAGEEGYE